MCLCCSFSGFMVLYSSWCLRCSFNFKLNSAFIRIHFKYSTKCLISQLIHRSHSTWLPVGQSTGLTATAAELQYKYGRHSLPNWLQSTNAPGHNPLGQGTQSVPRAAQVLVRRRAMNVLRFTYLPFPLQPAQHEAGGISTEIFGSQPG